MDGKIEKKDEEKSLVPKDKIPLHPHFAKGEGGGLKKSGSFINFRYSSRSIVSFGGKTYVKAKEKKFENGKLESQEFEGTVEGDMTDLISTELIKSAQKMLTSIFKPLSFFLPRNKEKGK